MQFGCASDNVNIPEGVLSEDKMVEIIADIQLLEAAHKTLSLNSAQQKEMKDTSYIIVFNAHNTTSVEFDSSLRVYTQYPEVFSEIMEKANRKISNK